MGQVTFTSHKIDLPASSEAVFHFLNNLNNFQKMMPEQVINWQSTEDDCEFDIKGMAHIGLVKTESLHGKFVLINSKPDNPIDLTLRGNVEKTGDKTSYAWIELTASLSPILQMMASAPLQNLVNIMADKMKSVEF